MTPLVLVSASPRRRELLATLGVPFIIEPTGVDETIAPGEDPETAATRLAFLKVRACSEPYRWVLGADTVVALDGEIFGKPEDAAGAEEMLRRLRGRWHIVGTGVAVRTPAGELRAGYAATRVLIREFSDAEMLDYIASGDPFDKAGAYAIQNESFHPVERHDGDRDNVVGLPLNVVRALAPELFGVT